MTAGTDPRDRLRVVLVRPRNPLNIGAAARAMSNFGFFHLRLVRPYELAFREARSAVGAAELLQHAEVFETLSEALADCSLVVGTTDAGRRELQHPLRQLEYGARLIRGHWNNARAALLFGSEKHGLSNDDLAYCDWLMRIPTREEHSSMNLGQAVAVCLYELIRNPRSAIRQPKPPAAAESQDLDRLATLLESALSASGYLNPRTVASSRNKLLRLVRRMNLTARDAEIWLGMLRQILWKLNSTAR